MNQKGFAVSGIVYTILIICLIVTIGILSLFNSRKNILDNLKNKIIGEVNTGTSIHYDPFETTGEILEFTAKAKGYYQFDLYSPKIGSNNGSEVTTEIYLSRGETLYILIGSPNYNNGNTEIRTSRNNASTTIIRASNYSMVVDNYNGKIFSNTIIQNQTVTSSTGKVLVTYLNKERLNSDLNKVKYIKDCIGGSSDNRYIWSSITALVDGDDKARNKKVIGSSEGENLNLITDGLNGTYGMINGTGEQCVIVDLERTYNLDSIILLHSSGNSYYGNKTYVSSDGVNYELIRTGEQTEGMNGISIHSYETKQVFKVGDIYVPMKEFAGATWIRVFHHNNLNGTELWSSVSQPGLSEGYDVLHRQSILSYLDDYKGLNGYEFLLEYEELNGYNRWIQSTNPLTTTKTSSAVPGYKAISISWNQNGWGGLSRSSTGSTLLDGSISGQGWYYAIGVNTAWQGGIPGPNSVIKGSVDLWIRIDNLNNN